MTQNQIKRYQVTLVIETTLHPRKWVTETLALGLQKGEDITEFDIKELKDE